MKQMIKSLIPGDCFVTPESTEVFMVVDRRRDTDDRDLVRYVGLTGWSEETQDLGKEVIVVPKASLKIKEGRIIHTMICMTTKYRRQYLQEQ